MYIFIDCVGEQILRQYMMTARAPEFSRKLSPICAAFAFDIPEISDSQSG